MLITAPDRFYVLWSQGLVENLCDKVGLSEAGLACFESSLSIKTFYSRIVEKKKKKMKTMDAVVNFENHFKQTRFTFLRYATVRQFFLEFLRRDYFIGTTPASLSLEPCGRHIKTEIKFKYRVHTSFRNVFS